MSGALAEQVLVAYRAVLRARTVAFKGDLAALSGKGEKCCHLSISICDVGTHQSTTSSMLLSRFQRSDEEKTIFMLRPQGGIFELLYPVLSKRSFT